jgi:polyisoprenyl-phosphate glycosyltransferase
VASVKKISIVIPVYRESVNLPALYSRLEGVTRSISWISWDYIFVNDGSPDDSLVVLSQLAASDRKCRVIDLSRNFGKEIALTAGVHEVVDADAVICMDADLQHPPELIPEFIRNWESGAEVVVTVRRVIKNQPILRRVGSHCYYWLMSKISGLDMVSQTTDFRLYDIKVIRAFARATERERMFRGIMDWMGFRRSYVEFAADARNDGEAGYSYKKLIKLAVGSIMSFSLWPLKLTGYLGLAITCVSSLLLLWMIANYLLHTQWVYTPLAMAVVANTFLIGIVLMAIGLVALYVGSIHTEVINRPLYVIRDRINFDHPADRNEPN